MAKVVDVKALRDAAKQKRAEIAEAKRSLAAANKTLREHQKVVTGITKMIAKADIELGRIKAQIAK